MRSLCVVPELGSCGSSRLRAWAARRSQSTLKVAHRDLKIDNLCLMSTLPVEQNTLKVIDFGCATCAPPPLPSDCCAVELKDAQQVRFSSHDVFSSPRAIVCRSAANATNFRVLRP